MGSRTKARDADRDRHVDLLEAAYADGQLTASERESRVAAALTSSTLGELKALVSDLQTTPRPAPVAPVATRKPARWIPGVIAAGVVLAMGVFAFWLFPDDHPPIDQRPMGQGPLAQVEPEVIEESWAPTAPALRDFRTDYERKFGTLDVYKMWIHADSVYVEVPTRSANPRWEGWNYDGEWSLVYEARAVDDTELSSLAKIRFDAFVANIGRAENELNVENGRFDGAHLRRWRGTDYLTIRVANEYDEAGQVETTPAGRIVDRSPFGA